MFDSLLRIDCARCAGHALRDTDLVMSSDINNWGSLPYLERLMQFAGARNSLLNDSIANLDTPGYTPKDVSAVEFQQAMREALAEEESGKPGARFRDTQNIRFESDAVSLQPIETEENILFHDGNDRSLERLMQGLSENFLAFRYAAELFRNTHETLNSAIRLRP